LNVLSTFATSFLLHEVVPDDAGLVTQIVPQCLVAEIHRFPIDFGRHFEVFRRILQVTHFAFAIKIRFKKRGSWRYEKLPLSA